MKPGTVCRHLSTGVDFVVVVDELGGVTDKVRLRLLNIHNWLLLDEIETSMMLSGSVIIDGVEVIAESLAAYYQATQEV